MADTKISELPIASALSGAEVVPVVQSASSKRTTASAIAGLVDLSDYSTTAQSNAAYATAAQGALADTAVQPADLNPYATTAASDAAYQPKDGLNQQTGTTYELVAGDKNTLVTLNNVSPVTVNVDSDGITWEAGDKVHLLNIGAGDVTIQGGGTTAVTINVATGQSAVLAQYSAATLIFLSDTVAALVGGMEAS